MHPVNHAHHRVQQMMRMKFTNPFWNQNLYNDFNVESPASILKALHQYENIKRTYLILPVLEINNMNKFLEIIDFTFTFYILHLHFTFNFKNIEGHFYRVLNIFSLQNK